MFIPCILTCVWALLVEVYWLESSLNEASNNWFRFYHFAMISVFPISIFNELLHSWCSLCRSLSARLQTKVKRKRYQTLISWCVETEFSSFEWVVNGFQEIKTPTHLFPVGIIVPPEDWDLSKPEVNPSSSTRTAVMVDWARTKLPSTLAGIKNVPDCNCDVLTNFRFMGERLVDFKVPWSWLSFASDISCEPFSVLASGQSSATMVSSWESEEGLYTAAAVRCLSAMYRPYPDNLVPWISEFESARDESLFELIEPMLELQENLESRDIELSFDMSDRRLSPLQRGSCLSKTVSDSESVGLTGCKHKKINK